MSAAYLAICADIVAGTTATASLRPGIAVTVELRVTVVGAPPDGPFVATAGLVRHGRAVVMRVDFADLTESRFALAHASFVARRGSEQLGASPIGSSHVTDLETHVYGLVGCAGLAPGSTSVPADPHLLNPDGALQGGVHAVLAESAALSLCAPGAFAHDLHVRYLRPVRGEARAVAEMRTTSEAPRRCAEVVIGGAAPAAPGAIATVLIDHPSVAPDQPTGPPS